MIIKKLLLERFRLHNSLLLEFVQPTVVIIGANASGKTSIVEAIQLIATGNSFRAEKIQEMISFEHELGRVKSIVAVEPEQSIESALSGEEQAPAEELELEVLLTRGEVQGKKTQSRLFSVNGVRRQKRTMVGQLKVVSFRPEDMRLIEGSPSRRREFLDMPLMLLSSEYEQALTNYENILKRRNRLLEAVREREQPRSVLQYWNMGLLKYGTILQQMRRDFIGSFATVSFPYDFAIEYQPSVISQERQDEYIEREIASGHSLIGPHKDDFIVTMAAPPAVKNEERVNVAVYGSRGQQRLAVLWLKTCELEYITSSTQQYPVLLLDDILSELDPDSRELVTELLGKTQAIVTTIDESGVA
ncbi:DNA replication and repair protein RecF, partial [Candidatus Woesebacteria bacterium]|nr:DNA replication and repair protein RecF [Candidatus Woesebacteria bacterium]